MGLRLLVIADPKIPVPPLHYGGAERIVDLLCRGLSMLGHEVDLLAAEGSKSYGGRVSFHRLPGCSWLGRAWRKLRFQFQSLSLARHADVVINFGRLDYLEGLLRTSKPLICCFQNPIHQTEVDWLLSRRREQLALVGISEFQVNGFLPPGIFSVIHNATDMERFNFHPHPAQPPYLVFLGRLTANKGVDTAIAVAKKTGMLLKLAGNVSDEPGGKEFFEQIVRPQLGEGIEYIGPVDDVQKNDLLGYATGCLFPIRWPEPFGIVMVESLACGTPVIATRCASTPEVITQGITGFVGETEEDLVEAVRNLNCLDRKHCRLAAEERFSGEVMTRRYLQVVDQLLHKPKRI